MTDNEKFLFDLWGYVVVEDVLTSDEVALANEAVDRHAHLIANRDPGLSHGSKHLEGATGSRRVSSEPIDV